jgi:hypothetical protein
MEYKMIKGSDVTDVLQRGLYDRQDRIEGLSVPDVVLIEILFPDNIRTFTDNEYDTDFGSVIKNDRHYSRFSVIFNIVRNFVMVGVRNIVFIVDPSKISVIKFEQALTSNHSMSKFDKIFRGSSSAFAITPDVYTSMYQAKVLAGEIEQPILLDMTNVQDLNYDTYVKKLCTINQKSKDPVMYLNINEGFFSVIEQDSIPEVVSLIKTKSDLTISSWVNSAALRKSIARGDVYLTRQTTSLIFTHFMLFIEDFANEISTTKNFVVFGKEYLNSVVKTIINNAWIDRSGKMGIPKFKRKTEISNADVGKLSRTNGVPFAASKNTTSNNFGIVGCGGIGMNYSLVMVEYASAYFNIDRASDKWTQIPYSNVTLYDFDVLELHNLSRLPLTPHVNPNRETDNPNLNLKINIIADNMGRTGFDFHNYKFMSYIFKGSPVRFGYRLISEPDDIANQIDVRDIISIRQTNLGLGEFENLNLDFRDNIYARSTSHNSLFKASYDGGKSFSIYTMPKCTTWMSPETAGGYEVAPSYYITPALISCISMYLITFSDILNIRLRYFKELALKYPNLSDDYSDDGVLDAFISESKIRLDPFTQTRVSQDYPFDVSELLISNIIEIEPVPHV